MPVISPRPELSLSRLQSFSRMVMPEIIQPSEVIKILNSNKIKFVLVGAYGIASWKKERRVTEDVDVVVAARQVRKAVGLLLAAFPDLEAVDLPVVVRLRKKDSDFVAIDVMKPNTQPVMEVLKNCVEVSDEGQKYHIPTLEMALVMKFAAMARPNRQEEDKHRDAGDFIRMVKSNADIDRQQVASLASLIYPEGGKDVLKMVNKALAGKPLEL